MAINVDAEVRRLAGLASAARELAQNCDQRCFKATKELAKELKFYDKRYDLNCAESLLEWVDDLLWKYKHEQPKYACTELIRHIEYWTDETIKYIISQH